VIRYKNEEILIGAAVSAFGFFALAMLPVCLELSVECTYPHMSEATSAGLLWMFG
jgi:FLVCR family MFS transporter 7